MPGPLHPLLGEPLAGADADLLAEAAGEGPYGHGLLLGHVPQLDRFVQAAQGPGTCRGRGRLLGVGDRAVDVLGLAAVPVRRYDGAAGHVVGDRRAVVAAHHVQAQVDPGGHTGRGQHVAVVDEQDVRVDLDRREQPLEAFGVRPVRGGRAAGEEARGGEHVHAGADGGEASAGADVGERGGQFVGEHALLEDRAEFVRRRDDHGVGGGEGLRAVGHVDGEVGVRADRAGWSDRAGHDLVEMPSRGVLGTAEDPVRYAQLEGEQAVQREDDHAVRTELWFTAHGPILVNAVLRANGSRGARGRSSLS